VSPDAVALDGETIVGEHDYDTGYPSENDDGSINAIVEIPAGTTAKFEIAADGRLHWEHDRDDGSRREIDYLAYPVNYGSVPCTLAADGDALDVIVLGRAIERGRVAHTRMIGVLEMADGDGVRDDKVIAVPLDPDLANGFTRLHDLGELDLRYAGSRAILLTWFSSYWGLGNTHVIGWGDAADAARVLAEAKACNG